MKFLCWNVNRKPLESLVALLAHSLDIDIVILLEASQIDPVAILLALNPTQGEPVYQDTDSQVDSIKVFTRFSRQLMRPVFESGRFSIRHLTAPGGIDMLLAIVHLGSKLYATDPDQTGESSILSATIRDEENRIGHGRTVVIGDFNMNPFDPGMVAAYALNATMSRREALKGRRTVQSREYPFFYNPMWMHFGDGDDAPAATYFYDRHHHVNYYWNMFDQVLIRPELISRFRRDELRIVTSAGAVALTDSNGYPSKTTASDHLPLYFELDLI